MDNKRKVDFEPEVVKLLYALGANYSINHYILEIDSYRHIAVYPNVTFYTNYFSSNAREETPTTIENIIKMYEKWTAKLKI